MKNLRTMITGHRLFKLRNYDIEYIKIAIEEVIKDYCVTYGISGAASGVDLWFCELLKLKFIPYAMYIPFEEQKNEMSVHEQIMREGLIDHASCIKKVRNSQMVEECDKAIVVWDGNKGGTHNVFQQLIEADKPFVWIEPKHEKIRYID